MKPDRYELSPPGRRRLSGFLQQRGARLGLPAAGKLLFGSLFVAAGILIILVGTKTLAVNPASVHAPYWVLTVAGASFAMGGLVLWGMAGRHFAADRRRVRAAREYPNEPALADYRWHPERFEVSGWKGAARAVGFALGLSVFLSIFNWWAFWGNGGWMVKAIVIVFDCVTLAVWWLAARQVGSALKFGHSWIAFTRFPYRLAEPVIVRWQPADGISQINKGTFMLRCVEEWLESRGSAKHRTVTLVHEEIWGAKWVLEQARKLQVKEAVELRYELPPDAQPTQLNAPRPVFWELEVQLDLPGLDFRETYLVPIYGWNTTAREADRALEPVAAAA